MPEMFDSIDPAQIPAGQDAAGYVDGQWRTFTALHGPSNLSVAVFPVDDAEALDVEPGDATNADAPGWVKRELGLGHWRPCLYTSVANLPGLLAALGAGIQRSQVRIWTAHYTYQPHRCTHACNQQLPADFLADATQWTDRSGGKNLDESELADDFFDTPAPSDLIGDNEMLIGVDPGTNNLIVVGAAKDNGNLLVFECLDDSNPTAPKWSVIDVTDNIGVASRPPAGYQVV